MRFIIRQKFVSVSERYTIEDEAGNVAYKVYRQAISLKKRWSIRNMRNEEVAIINNIVFSLLPKFEIVLNDENYAKVNKKFSLFGDVFEVQSSMGNYSIKGNHFTNEYEIKKDEQVVAIISKKRFSLADTYGVEINEGENINLILPLVISVDATHEGR